MGDTKYDKCNYKMKYVYFSLMHKYELELHSGGLRCTKQNAPGDKTQV